MTDSRENLLRLNAALDGELGPMEQAAFEREMRDDPALAAEFARLSATRDAIQRAIPREKAPADLVARIAALAEPPSATVIPFRPPTPAPQARQAWSARGALSLAASLCVLGFAAGIALTSLRGLPPPPGAETALVSDFARAAIAGQPYDVASSDRHTVKPWLAGRTTVSADIVDLAAQGFPLAGGRVSVIDRIPAPTLVYRHNEHFVAVTELPAGAKPGAATVGVETIDGYHVARWSSDGLDFVAVSDADEAALGDFVAAFRRGKPHSAE